MFIALKVARLNLTEREPASIGSGAEQLSGRQVAAQLVPRVQNSQVLATIHEA